MNFILIAIFLLFGYLLGKITCNSHIKKYGLWITLIIFVVINAIHSFIDGSSLVTLSKDKGLFLMFIHEVIRQPILYVLFFGIVIPFKLSKASRIVTALFMVSGIWLISVFLGILFGNILSQVHTIEPYLSYFQFLFIGDMVHHIVDWYHHKQK